jgi:hypothetical protein
MDSVTINRLALIKYLANQAMKETTLAEPLNGFSILSFHDAIELFLNLICEEKNIKIPNSFMDYWTEIDKNIQPDRLSHKTSMQKLNKARVVFKHHGIIPSKIDIESFKVMTESFFNENYIKFFTVELNDISLVELIRNRKSKSHLMEAEKAFEMKQMEECLINLAKSFGYLLVDYESNKKDSHYKSPFNFNNAFSSMRQVPNKIDYETKKFLTSIASSIEKIQNVLRLITLGIDYKQYVKFAAITPNFHVLANGEILNAQILRKSISKDDFELCRDFIIETALKLQETDFKLDENDYYG